VLARSRDLRAQPADEFEVVEFEGALPGARVVGGLDEDLALVLALDRVQAQGTICISTWHCGHNSGSTSKIRRIDHAELRLRGVVTRTSCRPTTSRSMASTARCAQRGRLFSSVRSRSNRPGRALGIVKVTWRCGTSSRTSSISRSPHSAPRSPSV
jgi:hypothetical protein